MANMSYCRFQNTVADLHDCYENMILEDGALPSAQEQAARWRLIRLCCHIADDFGDDLRQHEDKHAMGVR